MEWKVYLPPGCTFVRRLWTPFGQEIAQEFPELRGRLWAEQEASRAPGRIARMSVEAQFITRQK